MSGGSQHNPNGRQAQIGAGWSPLQVANFLARAPQAHMAERGVTWHTPTPPPHLYVPAPSPPDPLQAMKSAGNSVFRHTATPPDMYRHPGDTEKHLLRHTPSPGDVKTPPIPPAELYPHLGAARDKLVRPEELLYGRGVDLSVGSARNGNPSPAPPAHPAHPSHPSPALSVRDAPTINSLIARAQPRTAGHARVDALLERLAAPGSPHSVIVHPRAHHHAHTPTPSPPSSNEDSADSCGAPPGSKRKRKPERTVRMPSIPPLIPPIVTATVSSPLTNSPRTEPVIENGDSHQNGPETSKNNPKNPNPPETQPEKPPTPPPSEPQPHARRKTRANSAETIDDIAAMIASDPPVEAQSKPPEVEPEAAVSIDKLKSVLASPDSKNDKVEEAKLSPKADEKEKEKPAETIVEAAAAPKRRSARTSNSEATNVPVESPSEAIPAEPEASEARSAEPTAASFVEVENQLEKMFAGLEETPKESQESEQPKPKKRRKSAPTKGETKAGRRAVRASTGDGRRKGGKKKGAGKAKKPKEAVKDAYDSGSNASSSRSRGPYIQIRGPRDSPLSVNVINASTADDEGEGPARRKRPDDFRNGLRVRGLHASTLGLRYDATTPDATWLCAFCERGPHYAGLGDLFGPYTADTDCTEYRMLDESSRSRHAPPSAPGEVWFHVACGVWAPGLVAAGARVWGLAAAVWGARAQACGGCGRAGAGLACTHRHCRARTHYPCAMVTGWKLDEEEFRATCPVHAEGPA